MLLIGSVEYLPNHFCSFFGPFLSGYMALFANELMISDHKTQGTTCVGTFAIRVFFLYNSSAD